MRKALILPAVSVAGGVVGLAVRQLYLRQAFEPGTGLPVSGQPVTGGLWAVAIVTAVAIVLLSGGKHRTFEKNYVRAFGGGSLIQTAGVLAGAVLLVLGGFFNIAAYVQAPADFYTQAKTVSIVRPVLGVVSLLAGAGLWFLLQKVRARGKIPVGWSLMPGFACCLWVMANYQQWAQDPVLERYLFCLLAVLLSMVACYCLPGFVFGKGQVRLTVVTCLLAAAFSIMVLGDGLPLMDVALYLAMVFYLLSMASVLLDNDAKPEPVLPPNCGGSCQGCPGCGPVEGPKEG